MAATNRGAGRHFRNRGLLESREASRKISDSLPNSEGCTVSASPSPNFSQFFAPFCQLPMTSGAASARKVITISGTTHLSQDLRYRMKPMPTPMDTRPASM